jgi:hypothetical protein
VGGFGGGDSAELITIEPDTGVGTLIGNLGLGPLSDVSGLALLPDGTLLAYDPQTSLPSRLLEDEFAAPIDPSAMAFDEDGGLFVLSSGTAPPEIYEVDPTDATVLARVPLPGLPLAFAGGMEFNDSTGILYLSCGDMLYRANPYTGGTILVGPTPAGSALETVGDCGLPLPVVMPIPPRLGSDPGLIGTGTPGTSASGSAEPRRERAAAQGGWGIA